MRNECLGVTISVKSWIMSPCILVCLCMKLLVKFASQQLRIQFSKFQSKALSSLALTLFGDEYTSVYLIFGIVDLLFR